jgi:alpha-mannosidase
MNTATLHRFCTLIAILACMTCGRLGAAETKIREVVIAFKTHFDIGYTDMARNVVQRYRTTMIDQALGVVDRNRNLPPQEQFVWTIPGWPLAKIMEDWPGQTAQRKQRIEQAFKEGRFVVHALPFSLHTELLEMEDLVRGLEFSSRSCRAAHLPLPRDAKMTDVACHSWIMPTLLKNAGVDFLHIGCNWGIQGVQVPMLFWWEGPDGSRLLTMYSHSYGSGLGPPRDWPYKTWLALIHTGDNHGPPTPEEVQKVLADARKTLPGVKIRIGRLSDFADAILAEHPDLPVIHKDMCDTWIHGPMSNPDGCAMARTTRPLLAAAEALHTLLPAWGVKVPDVAPAMAKAYENSLLYGEHTWGAALYWLTGYSGKVKFFYGDEWKAHRAAGDYKRVEESWEEHTNYIRTARDTVMPILNGDLQRLAKAVNVSGRRIVVFNPLPWQRDGVVRLRGAGKAIKAIGAEGEETETVATDGNDLVFVARQVPPGGYRAYVPTDRPPKAPAVMHSAENTIENRFFKITLDPAQGTVCSLVDKTSGRELVDAKAAHGFGQYLYERFDADNVAEFFNAYAVEKADWTRVELGKANLPPASKAPYRAVSPRFVGAEIKKCGPMIQAVFNSTPTADLAHKVTTKVILYDGLPFVDLEVTLHSKPADPWPEAGWLCLPFAVEKPRFLLGRQASIVDPTKDVVRGGNRHLFGINTGVAIIDGHYRGAAFCAIDNPLVSLDRPGLWKYSLDFLPQKPVAYVNLFNNMYTTNFRLWNEGTWTSRVRVWPFSGSDDQAEDLIENSLEARSPLLAAESTDPAGTLPIDQYGVGLSPRGAIVTAFGPNEAAGGTVLRLWELAGLSADRNVQLPWGMQVKNAQPIDLRGRPTGNPIPVKDGHFSGPLRPFAPASFLLK